MDRPQGKGAAHPKQGRPSVRSPARGSAIPSPGRKAPSPSNSMRKSPRKQKNNAVGVGGEDGEDRYIVEIMEYSSEEEESDEMPLTQPEVHFPITKVEKELSQILQGGMDKLTMYEPEEVSDMCQQLANDARDLAKRSGASERYRYVAQAKIGAINGGGMLVGTKCLWDVETDTFVHASYRNRHDLFGVLVIHALYKD